MNKHMYHYKAFSLVEILVVLGLFSSIATLSLGAIFNAQAINGRLQETQAILDNVNLSYQMITREVRFGSVFYCDSSIIFPTTTVPTMRRSCSIASSTEGTTLIFRPADSPNILDRIAYYVKNGVLYKDEYFFGKSVATEQLTSDDVSIKRLTFYVDGAHSSDGSNDYASTTDYKQPLITILVSGETKPANITRPSVPFSIQTSVSAREIDNR